MQGQVKGAVLMTLLLAVIVAGMTLSPINVPAPFRHADKFYHVAAFAALVLPIAALQPRWLYAAIPALGLFGGLIEVVQPYVGRECNFWDWIADLAGVALGTLAGLGGRRFFVRRSMACA